MNYINKNLEQNLNVDEIAEECAVSPSHFHRIFKTYVGISVMDYIRSRRLQNAISQITVGMNILDAAVMSGYETHTGFLKAFKKAYGITPKKIKNNGGFMMTPTIFDRPEFKLAGYVLKKDTNNPAAFQAPTFYDNDENMLLVNGTRVETLLDEIVKPKKHGEYCFFYSSDNNKSFDYVMCSDCDDFTQIPDGLFKITVPAAQYAVFTTPPADAKNNGTEIAIRDTWKYIFDEWLPNSCYVFDDTKLDFEYYDLRCHTDTNSVMEIHVPIKLK